MQQQELDWQQVEWWDVEQLVPYANNPKTHPQKQIDGLAKAIADHGWDVPIVVDEAGVILKGHGRRLAALQLELATVPVIVRQGLTERQKKALRIADNKWAESPWDQELLALEMSEISDLLEAELEASAGDADAPEIDFAFEDLGFSEGELNTLVEAVESQVENQEEEESGVVPSGPDALDPSAKQEAKYPLAIVLSWAESQEWQTIKEAIGEKSDKKAFLKLMHGEV